MEALIYNQKGDETGKIKLPEAVFGLPKNDDLVHQVVVSMQSNMRTPVAHTKGRGDVRGEAKNLGSKKEPAEQDTVQSVLLCGAAEASRTDRLKTRITKRR